MAAAAQQVALQRVAAAAVFPTQLKPTVLGKNKASPVSRQGQHTGSQGDGARQTPRALSNFHRALAFTLAVGCQEPSVGHRELGAPWRGREVAAHSPESPAEGWAVNGGSGIKAGCLSKADYLSLGAQGTGKRTTCLSHEGSAVKGKI